MKNSSARKSYQLKLIWVKIFLGEFCARSQFLTGNIVDAAGTCKGWLVSYRNVIFVIMKGLMNP